MTTKLGKLRLHTKISLKWYLLVALYFQTVEIKECMHCCVLPNFTIFFCEKYGTNWFYSSLKYWHWFKALNVNKCPVHLTLCMRWFGQKNVTYFHRTSEWASEGLEKILNHHGCWLIILLKLIFEFPPLLTPALKNFMNRRFSAIVLYPFTEM